MKFEAVKDVSTKITNGKYYYGNVVMQPELKNGKIDNDIRIVVLNDEGHWRDYHPSTFVPVED